MSSAAGPSETTVVPIPDFFIALVLPDESNRDTAARFRIPFADETEELRQQTVRFWNRQLENIYNNNNNKQDDTGKKKASSSAAVSFEGIQLTIKHAIFGPTVGSRRDHPGIDLDDRFNAYLELGGTATFAAQPSKSSKREKTAKKKPSIPTGNDVFRKMVAGDSMEYLCRFVKNDDDDEKRDGDTTTTDGGGGGGGLSSSNVYSGAIEVCAKRTEEDPDDRAFVVRTPTFFVALATDPYDDEEARDPTPEEVRELTKRTGDRIRHHVREDYPTALLDCDLKLVRSEVGAAVPDDKFRLYYEHEVTATFSNDPPSQDELFALVMRCANEGFSGYMESLREMNGTPYVAVTMMTIQIVGLDNQPEPLVLEEPPAPGPPPSSPPPPPKQRQKKRKEEEEEEEEERGSGDEKEEEEDKKSVTETPPPSPTTARRSPATPPVEKERVEDLSIRNVPIFLALVVSAEPPAKLPTPSELKDFENLVLRYFYTVLKREYSDALVDMVLVEKDQRFESGIPEPRFNMCVEYDATIRFRNGPAAPDKKTLKKLVLKVNLSTLLAYVKDLDARCFERASEISMRKKPKKETHEKQKIKDAAFEAAVDVDLLEPPPVEDETTNVLEQIAAAKEVIKEDAASTKKKKKKAEENLPTKKLVDDEANQKKAEDVASKKKAEEKLAKMTTEREAAKKKADEEAAEKKAEEKAAKKKAEQEAEAAAAAAAAKEKAAAEEAAATAAKAREEAATAKKKKPKKEKKPSNSNNGAVGASDPPDDDGSGGRRVKTAEVYTAFKLNYCDSDPSDDEYEKLRENTQKYFKKRLQKEFGSQLSEVRLKILHKEFGAEKPQKHFNVYVEWDIETVYKSDDTGTDQTSTLVSADGKEHTVGDGDGASAPNPEKLTRVLVQQTDLMDYLVKVVQPIRKTAFANVTMGFMGAKVSTKTTF